MNLGQHTVALLAIHLDVTRLDVSTKAREGTEYGESIGKFGDFVPNWDDRKRSRPRSRSANDDVTGIVVSKKGTWYVLGGVLTDNQEEVDTPRSNASFADTTNTFSAMDTSGTVTTVFQAPTCAIHASFNWK